MVTYSPLESTIFLQFVSTCCEFFRQYNKKKVKHKKVNDEDEYEYQEDGDDDDYKTVKGARFEDDYKSQHNLEMADDDSIQTTDEDQMVYRDEDNRKQHDNITLITTESQYEIIL